MVNSEAEQRRAAPAPLVLRGADVACRVLTWPFQPHTAQLVMYQQHRTPTVAELHQWNDQLHQLGFERVRTTALSALAGRRVEAAGFRPIQELVLLEHCDPAHPFDGPRRSPHGMKPTIRLNPTMHQAASDIDVAAFGIDWSLDTAAVGAVRTATPRHRARGAGSPLAAYAISGRDSKQGFLQRLAVHPDHQRRGLGAALVLDSLRWLARWRVSRVLVNTPTDNVRALALYERIGFRRLDEGLRLYERTLV